MPCGSRSRPPATARPDPRTDRLERGAACGRRPFCFVSREGGLSPAMTVCRRGTAAMRWRRGSIIPGRWECARDDGLSSRDDGHAPAAVVHLLQTMKMRPRRRSFSANDGNALAATVRHPGTTVRHPETTEMRSRRRSIVSRRRKCSGGDRPSARDGGNALAMTACCPETMKNAPGAAVRRLATMEMRRGRRAAAAGDKPSSREKNRPTGIRRAIPPAPSASER